MTVAYPKISQFKDIAAFRQRLHELNLELPADDRILTRGEGSPLAQPIALGELKAGNRWCIHPMEGWDANRDGSPSEFTLRRWRNFGLSGAKLIWGGEASAVQADGRSSPHQVMAAPQNKAGLASLLDTLKSAHRDRFGNVDDLVVGLQLTHSGRFSRPYSEKLAPRIAYHHPLLDEKFGIDPADEGVVWTDEELEQLVDSYAAAAGAARDVGFQFVDVKACHGYLLHELLSARTRPGRFGGDLEGRTQLLLTIVRRVREAYPDLTVGVRLSIFDMPPFARSQGVGAPMHGEGLLPYRYGFGLDENNPLNQDLQEPLWLIGRLQQSGAAMINVSGGSPYYNPHAQRPAIFPPSDGYPLPEDPLAGVVRHIQAARRCKAAFPDLPMIGSGYTYLQDYLPHVAQAAVRSGWIDIVGLGRMALSYPELPHDVLSQGRLNRKRICRTFSDCTTAPRHGLVSGCYPLDPFFKSLPQAAELKQIKRRSSGQ